MLLFLKEINIYGFTKKIDVLIYFVYVRGPDPPTPLRHSDATGGQKRLLTHPLYRKQRPRLDITAIELRPWQEQAMQLFETPTERQVIWITGRQGNEGKSWFQGYIDSFYGFNRVVRMDLRIKHANLQRLEKTLVSLS